MVLCLAAYLAPYFYSASHWWRFVPSTVLILGLGTLLGGRDAIRFLGLRMSKRDLLLSGALFGVALLLSRYVLTDVIGESLGIERGLTPRWQVHQFFQVLNDEMVMRAALMSVVLRALPHPRLAIPLLALVFAIGHRVFYALDGVEVGAVALLTLFAFGAVGNTLFVRFGHIGYGVALHYAWNFYRFNTAYYLDGRLLSEGETFNAIEGQPRIVVASILLMVAVYGAYLRWGLHRSAEPGATSQGR